MRLWVLLAAALASGQASATVVQPTLGVTATEARVGGNGSGGGTFHVLSGSGTPGTTVTDYNPAGYFGTLSSSVSASQANASDNGRNTSAATGSAAVDLASGQMHIVANATTVGSGSSNASYSAVAASATMSDTLHIVGSIVGNVTIRISMTVDGSIVGTSSAGGVQTDLRNAIGAFALAVSGGGGPYAELFLNQLNGSSIQEQDVSSYGGKVITDGGNAGSLSFTLYDDVVVTDARRSIPFQATASLNLVAADQPGTISADFGNTARLAVFLPSGLSFTSDSGVFLTEPQDNVASVPEPGSLLLLLAGLAGALAYPAGARTRSRAAASSSSR